MKVNVSSVVIGLRDYGIPSNAIMAFVEKIMDAELDARFQMNDEISCRQIALAYNNAQQDVDRTSDSRYPANRLDILV